MLARAAAAVRHASQLIRALITAAVISAGETPVRAGPGAGDPQEVPAGRLHEPAASLAREQGLPAVPDAGAAPHLKLSRHAVLAGLPAVRRLPGARAQQPPARLLLECLHDREDDALRFISDLRISPTLEPG
jgi:hypothetical protein